MLKQTLSEIRSRSSERRHAGSQQSSGNPHTALLLDEIRPLNISQQSSSFTRCPAEEPHLKMSFTSAFIMTPDPRSVREKHSLCPDSVSDSNKPDTATVQK